MKTEIEIEINCKIKVTRIPNSIEINFVPIPENNSLIGKVYMVDDNSHIHNLSMQVKTTNRLFGNKVVIASEPYTSPFSGLTFVDVISPITLYRYSVLFNHDMVLEHEHINLPEKPKSLEFMGYIPTDNSGVVNLITNEKFPNVSGLELIILSQTPYRKFVSDAVGIEPYFGLFIDCINTENGLIYSIPFNEEFIVEY